MKLTIEKGNLFNLDLDKYTLAHCISLDCKMGAGIAKEFVKEFPMMKEELIHKIKKYNYNYPMALTYSDANGGKVINLITKEKYWHKPTYETLDKTLNDMYKICKECNIKHLAMPKIGCGLDRLSWDNVQLMIEEKFKDLDIEIMIRYI